MENTKENLDVQKFTVDEVMAAWMCLEDEDAKYALIYSWTPYFITGVINNKDFMDEFIKQCETQITYLEASMRGVRLIADMLQVPTNQEG